MTIDSAYFVHVYAADNDVVYTFTTESIGDRAMVVSKVLPDNTLVPLFNPSDFTINYDRSQEPTYIGGTITLTSPLAEGERLAVSRNTPIARVFNAEAFKPFEAEQFEFTMDKICFIQQEIEGHYCDCRSACTPPYITVQPYEVPPTKICKVYECDAIETALTEMNPTMWWRYLDGGSTPTAVTEITASTGGRNLVTNNQPYNNIPEGPPLIDNCEGYNWRFINEGGTGNGSGHGYPEYGNLSSPDVPLSEIVDIDGNYTMGFICAYDDEVDIQCRMASTYTGFTPAKMGGRSGAGGFIEWTGNGNHTFVNKVPNDGKPHSIIFVYRRNDQAPKDSFPGTNIGSYVELWIDGIFMEQVDQMTNYYTNVQRWVWAYGEDNGQWQDVFIDVRGWQQGDFDQFMNAFEQNKSTYIDPNPDCIPP